MPVVLLDARAFRGESKRSSSCLCGVLLYKLKRHRLSEPELTSRQHRCETAITKERYIAWLQRAEIDAVGIYFCMTYHHSKFHARSNAEPTC